jgi:hypothetical protein
VDVGPPAGAASLIQEPYDARMAELVVVAMKVFEQSVEAQRLVTCMVRRLTGDDDAEPDISHELLHITVQAEPGTDVPGIAIRLKDECAGDLGIEEPWQLVSVLRP